MGLFGISVTFIMVWWLVFFAALPFGVRSQAESGEKLPRGSEPAAPVDPKLKVKLQVTTLIAAVATLLIWVVVRLHGLDWLLRD